MKNSLNRGTAIMRGVLAVALSVVCGIAAADPVPSAAPATISDAKSQRSITSYQANSFNHPVPKFDYTDGGKAIMIKRYPFFSVQGFCQFTKYHYMENKKGVENFEKCDKLKREPEDVLSEQQKAILREWGQPDYLRGPFKSTQDDIVVEWAYHSTNHLFQFVDRTMVYEGPLTDQERTAITYGAPKETTISILEPNIRRETWTYRPTFLWHHEHVVSFTNGKLTYEQISD